MLDDQDSRIGELRSLAAKQCNYPDAVTLASMSVRDQVFSCLPQGCLARYDDYMRELPEKGSIGGDFVFDLDHNCGSMGRSGSLWPCLLTHGSIVAHTCEREVIATGREHLATLGWHLFPQAHAKQSVSPLSMFFKSISGTEAKCLAGRGIHLGTLGAWIFYILGNVVRLPKSAIMRPMSSCIEDSDSDSD